jgi:hypothetical protein
MYHSKQHLLRQVSGSVEDGRERGNKEPIVLNDLKCNTVGAA